MLSFGTTIISKTRVFAVFIGLFGPYLFPVRKSIKDISMRRRRFTLQKVKCSSSTLKSHYPMSLIKFFGCSQIICKRATNFLSQVLSPCCYLISRFSVLLFYLRPFASFVSAFLPGLLDDVHVCGPGENERPSFSSRVGGHPLHLHLRYRENPRGLWSKGVHR